MWPRRSHVLASIIESSSGPKGKKLLWNDALERSFKELKYMVSSDTLLSYPYCTIPFTVHDDASDKQVGAVISHNNKQIALFSRRLSKPQLNFTTTEKELLVILECLNKFHGILFGYEINVFSYHKNLVYAATLSESQLVMCWLLILEEFGTTIHHIYGVYNIVADALIKLPSTSIYKYKPITR